MKIELCEDNGFMSEDGKPTLVVLVVTRDDGKQVRIPYYADHTIQQLYEDVQKIGHVEISAHSIEENPAPVMSNRVDVLPLKGSTIERNDIIKCVHLEKDLDGNPNPDLEIGKEYRVIDIVTNGKVVAYYEVIDDNANEKMRIPIFPTECALVKKFTPGPPRRQVFEMTKMCDCGEVNSIELNGDRYVGQCEKCGRPLEEMRKANV